jgi:hypothetical protein
MIGSHFAGEIAISEAPAHAGSVEEAKKLVEG